VGDHVIADDEVEQDAAGVTDGVVVSRGLIRTDQATEIASYLAERGRLRRR
jgi:hypothetical protein